MAVQVERNAHTVGAEAIVDNLEMKTLFEESRGGMAGPMSQQCCFRARR